MRSPDLTSILGSDALLGCVFPVTIALVSLEILPLASERHGVAPDVLPSSHTNHTRSHRNYPRERCVFYSELRGARNTKRIANETGYAETLERLERAIEANSSVSSDIYRLATTKEEANVKCKDTSLGSAAEGVYGSGGLSQGPGGFEALRQGLEREERWRRMFGVVLNALKRLDKEVCGKREKRVLV
jgi:hypothetical protein